MPKTQLVTSHFIIHTQDYHTHVYSKNIKISTHLLSNIFRPEHKSFSSHRTQDLLVTHYDCEENEQKKHYTIMQKIKYHNVKQNHKL